MKLTTRVFDMPSAVEEIRHVQDVIRRDMRKFDYNEDSCFAVKLALEESLVNAVKHGNQFDPCRVVRVQYSIDESKLTISIRDEGRGFDPTCVPDPTAAENLTRPCGRGIMLMRAYMDDVIYSAKGNEITLVKHRQ
jgi:serine/threonine-protein kinase RsbW